MVTIKSLQLTVAVGLLVLFWMIYPGVLLMVAGAVAAAYVVAAMAAFRWRAAHWLALGFTFLALLFAVWGVYRYFANGFEWLGGNFSGRDGIYWPAYIFLLVALGSATVIVLQLLRGSGRPDGRVRN